MTIQEAQEECKIRFPIGCAYKDVNDSLLQTLIEDDRTYKIVDETIYAHTHGGLLYKKGQFAELISYPKGYKVHKNKVKENYNYLIPMLTELNTL